MPRITERDFVARHAAQRLSTADAATEPSLASAGIGTADVDNDGAIQGEPELRSVYQKLLSLDTSATPSGGVDLDAPGVKPVYGALAARFTQRTGTEAPLGTKKLADVGELAAVFAGVSSLGRKDGIKQLGVGSVQEALLVVAAAEEARTGAASLLRVNLGAQNANRGLFGPGTEGAVKELQRQVGLQVTGRLDANTLKALDDALAKARGASATVPTPPVTTPPSSSSPNARFNLPVFDDVRAGRVALRAGETGPAVAALQQALLDMGFPMMALQNDVGVSGVDGAWGGQTDTALKNFQIFAKRAGFTSVRSNGVLDTATMKAFDALSPTPGKRAWDAGEKSYAPTPRWNADASKPLRIVTVQDEHRTFLYDRQGQCTGIFSNAHGSAGNETATGLKKITAKLDENVAKSTGQTLWQNPRAFGKRIIDLSWASGGRSGEELHGTYDYRNMGKNVSHGCVRHYNEDIVTMFDAVSVGELVAIVTSGDDAMLK
jgi:lipoprotein-anchoring transpeptidase ErfK/SrfK